MEYAFDGGKTSPYKDVASQPETLRSRADDLNNALSYIADRAMNVLEFLRGSQPVGIPAAEKSPSMPNLRAQIDSAHDRAQSISAMLAEIEGLL